jgi:hypothetical protein
MHRWAPALVAGAIASFLSHAASAQVTVSVDRLDGAEPGTPVPANLVVVDVFVDVATTDVWTASGIRGLTFNGATLVYAGGTTPLINPGLANRFVTCLSKPRTRNADARFNNAGAATAGRYDPTGPTPVSTSTEVNATWFASPPENSGSPTFDGYIARVVIDISTAGVDPSTIVVATTQPAGTVPLFRSEPSSGSQPRGTVAATFDVPAVTGLNWGVYAQKGAGETGACCTPAGCLITTRAACAAAGGSYEGDGSRCGGQTYAPPESCVFENISASGTPAPTASACDDCGDLVPIGFSFSFFGTSHTSVNVCSNGYLTFGDVVNDFSNDPSFPNPETPNNVIAPYWDDWNPGAGGDVYYATLGVAPSRRFVVMWNQVLHFGVAGNPVTFEVVLFEGSNTIEYRYAAVNSFDTPTIGIEDDAGLAGVNVVVGTQGACTTIRNAPINSPCRDCDCDFNHDGFVNSQDFFEFLTCFFTGC